MPTGSSGRRGEQSEVSDGAAVGATGRVTLPCVTVMGRRLRIWTRAVVRSGYNIRGHVGALAGFVACDMRGLDALWSDIVGFR